MVPEPLVSIIIVDYKKQNPYLVECLKAIRKQTYTNFEVIIISDYKINLKYPKLRMKSFGRYVGPAEKRDVGAEMAKGEILAFIDDDAFPKANWLKNMVPHFNDLQIAGVGGPGVTPKNVTWQEEASGWSSASPLGSGPHRYRFLPSAKKYVDDFPSMNLAVRKTDFAAIGGFDSSYWPGEDTKLCLDLTQSLHKKIIYDPNVLVYHHRRPIWTGHLIQNGNFGLHRGFFARILPQTSLRIVYFLPSIMLLGTLYLLITLPNGPFPAQIVGLFLLKTYLIMLLFNSYWIYQKSKKLFQGVVSIPVILITHLWYGVRFLQGFLFTKKLSR